MQHLTQTTIGDGLKVSIIFDTWPDEIEIIRVYVPVSNNRYCCVRDELSEQCINHIVLACEKHLENDKQEALEIAYR